MWCRDIAFGVSDFQSTHLVSLFKSPLDPPFIKGGAGRPVDHIWHHEDRFSVDLVDLWGSNEVDCSQILSPADSSFVKERFINYIPRLSRFFIDKMLPMPVMISRQDIDDLAFMISSDQ